MIPSLYPAFGVAGRCPVKATPTPAETKDMSPVRALPRPRRPLPALQVALALQGAAFAGGTAVFTLGRWLPLAVGAGAGLARTRMVPRPPDAFGMGDGARLRGAARRARGSRSAGRRRPARSGPRPGPGRGAGAAGDPPSVRRPTRCRRRAYEARTAACDRRPAGTPVAAAATAWPTRTCRRCPHRPRTRQPSARQPCTRQPCTRQPCARHAVTAPVISAPAPRLPVTSPALPPSVPPPPPPVWQPQTV